MKYEISNSISTSFTSKANPNPNESQLIQKSIPCIITNEETRSLAGVVAKTRALFESNLNSQNFSTPQINKNKKNFKPFTSIQVSKEKYAILNPIENELDKENSLKNKGNETPIRPILRHNPRDNALTNRCEENKLDSKLIKKSYSVNRIPSCLIEEVTPRGRLNSANIIINKSEEISKELNIPMSVKQAKACFENLAFSSQKNFHTPLSKTSISSSVKARGDLIDGSKLPVGYTAEVNSKHEFSKNMVAIPDILNSLTSSSSSTASESSVFNNSSSSSCENTPRSADKKIIYKASKVADRIKKLEEIKPLITTESNNKSILPSAPLCSSLSSQFSTQTSPYSKSSKFVQLYQKQMEVNPTNYRKLEDIINEADQNVAQSMAIKEDKREKKLKSILRKGPKQEPFMISEIKIETKSTVRSPSSSSSSPSCSPSSSFSSLTIKQHDQKAEISQENIDNSSCVVPSKMRQRTQSLDIANTQESNFSLNNNVSKMNSSFTSGILKTPCKSVGSYIKNASYSSGNSNSGLVKRVTRSATNAREALIRWCRKMTEEYENVSISNFSSSWSDGLAFCALIHHFMPNEFDFSTLTSHNPRYNFDLAFKTAENRAGIVPLLDVDDMIEMGDSPDWKCVFTYVHSIYQRFKEVC